MRFRGTFVLAALVLAVSVPTASAQIISTSIPRELAPGAVEKKWAVHLMAGYAKWDYNLASDEDVSYSTPDGYILAGDLTFKATDDVSIGVGGFYNDAPFDVDFPSLNINPAASVDNSLGSFYANAFYKMVGAQVGLVPNSQTLTWSEELQSQWQAAFGSRLDSLESSHTDLNYYLVGRFGAEKWSVGVGLGAYQYRFDGGDNQTVASGFVNGSVKVWKNLSIDGGFWYLAKGGEGDAKIDAANRLTIGVGYTF
jgi:hypothetical protein